MDVAPSPKVQRDATTAPSGSWLVLVNAQVSPVQAALNDAWGGVFTGAPGTPWHGAPPESANVWPGSGMNSHS